LSWGGISTSFRPPSFGTFESVALLVFFAYDGVDSAACSAGEVKHPRRTIPRSMLLSLATTIVFYMIVQWAYIAAGAPASSNGTPLAAAAGVVMGRAGVIALTLAAVFSIASNSLTFFMTGPRVIFGMAERGLLPAGLAHVSPRFLTPDLAIALFTLIVAAISLSGTFAFLTEVTELGSLFISLCTYGAAAADAAGDARTAVAAMAGEDAVAAGTAIAALGTRGRAQGGRDRVGRVHRQQGQGQRQGDRRDQRRRGMPGRMLPSRRGTGAPALGTAPFGGNLDHAERAIEEKTINSVHGAPCLTMHPGNLPMATDWGQSGKRLVDSSIG
jgi:hypothetical protein